MVYGSDVFSCITIVTDSLNWCVTVQVYNIEHISMWWPKELEISWFGIKSFNLKFSQGSWVKNSFNAKNKKGCGLSDNIRLSQVKVRYDKIK